MTPNLVPDRDRAVSVARLDGALGTERLHRHFLGREVYRRTRYVVAWSGDEVALVHVERGDREEALFAPVTDLEVLATPSECVWVEAPETDTTVPTQLARVARERAPGARCVIVRGLYAHVNFILEPRPHVIRVREVVPPQPAKLIHQVEQVISTAEDLPPVELRPDVVDLRERAASVPASTYLFPCRGGAGTVADAEIAYLDERPPRRDWVLVGCARSRQLHEWFYGDLPESVELCPRLRAREGRGPTLTKCCLVESGLEETDTDTVTVPWGATTREVRLGIERLLGVGEAAWAHG